MHRPTPTDQFYAQTQQRSVLANFPDAEKFMDAFLDRFIDAIRDDLPAYHIYLAMAQITEVSLQRGKPQQSPAAARCRQRDRRGPLPRPAHRPPAQNADAPRTLEVFNATLGKAYLDFIAALPPIAKATARRVRQMRRGGIRSPLSR